MQILLSLLIVSSLFLGWSIDNYICERKYNTSQIWKRCIYALLIVVSVTAIYDTNCTSHASKFSQKIGKAPF